jgi:hypothetical protein
MSRWLTDFLQRPLQTLLPAALLILAPKCVVCVLAYAGIGTFFGIRRLEICGPSVGSSGPWVSLLALLGVALGIPGLFANRRCRRKASKGRLALAKK